MTKIEKLQNYRPDLKGLGSAIIGPFGMCPSNFGMMDHEDCCLENCVKCWNQEVEE